MIRATLPVESVYQSAPSEPAAMPPYVHEGGTAGIVTSVNQSAPSEPAAIPFTPADGVGTVNLVIVPSVVIRPIVLS